MFGDSWNEKENRLDSRPTFIDLFCGCGGFTLGMERAGFRCLAVDFSFLSSALQTVSAY
jgi:tRNA/tmRNA/rRNA uracil-C5-methylase (TrmA/RlmC/RlmD family)